jgi:DNA-binding transcriptional LysR family regulator
MQSDLLPAIAAFERVAHHASFTRAAAELGVSASALSQTLRTLEKRLGVRLLDRSTRHVGVTELGRRFLQQAEPGLASLAAAIDALNESRDRPAGLLRLNVSQTAAQIVVLPHLAAFIDAFPDVTVDLHCDNALVDLIAGGFDAGIRLGENLSDGVVALPLGGRQRLATVAAPSYLQGRKPPHKPEDLRLHRCLQARLPSGTYRWEYTHKGREFDIETHGPVLSNDGDVLLGAARAGAGIACAMEVQVEDDLSAGRLVPLLKPWWPSFPGFCLYHPSRSNVPRKLRAFIDFMSARCNP